jgi:hypothetical protein
MSEQPQQDRRQGSRRADDEKLIADHKAVHDVFVRRAATRALLPNAMIGSLALIALIATVSAVLLWVQTARNSDALHHATSATQQAARATQQATSAAQQATRALDSSATATQIATAIEQDRHAACVAQDGRRANVIAVLKRSQRRSGTADSEVTIILRAAGIHVRVTRALRRLEHQQAAQGYAIALGVISALEPYVNCAVTAP